MNRGERNSEIIRLAREAKLSQAEIGAQFGLTAQTVGRILRRVGQPWLRTAAVRADDKFRSRDAEIVRLAREGLTQTELGARFGIHQTTVGKILRRRGVDIIAERHAAIRRALETGESLRSIAERLGVSTDTPWRVRRKL